MPRPLTMPTRARIRDRVSQLGAGAGCARRRRIPHSRCNERGLGGVVVKARRDSRERGVRVYIEHAALVALRFVSQGSRVLLRAAIVFFLVQALPVMAQSASSNSSGVSELSSTAEAVRANGLETLVVFMGSDFANNRLVLSVRITNTDESSAYLALVGPEPSAVDSGGGIYKVQNLGGIATCALLSNSTIDNCIRNTLGVLPGTMFSLVPPGTSMLVNFELSSLRMAKEGLVSITMNAALGRGTRPLDDRSKNPKLEYIGIHLPLISLK